MGSIVFRNNPILINTPGSGTGQPILTLTAGTGAVTEIPSIDTSTFLTKTLATNNIFIGNAGLAIAAPMTGSVLINYSAGNAVSSIAPGVITTTQVASNAGILYSQLNLTGNIVNTDISSSAAIVRSKLASGTGYVVLVNNASGVLSEAAVMTNNRVMVTDSNGLPTITSITTTNLTSLDTTTSITTQLSNKLSFLSSITPVSGDLISYISGAWNRVALGSAGQYLTVNGGATGVTWVTGAAGLPTGGTTHQFLAKNTATNFDTSWYTLTVSLITDITITAAAVNSLNNWITSGGLATGTTNQALTVVGGLPTWTTLAGTGTVTSVALSGGTTGLTVSGSPITSSGTITLSGTLVAVNGGTGQSAVVTGDLLYGSASNTWSRLAVGTNGYILTLSGGIPTWAVNSGGGLTNNASNLELMMSNGTNAVHSNIYNSSAGNADLQLGAFVTGDRTISALNSGNSANLTLTSQANIYLTAGASGNLQFNVQGSTGFIKFDFVSSSSYLLGGLSSSPNFIITAANTTTLTGGNLTLSSGAPSSGATASGSVSITTSTPSGGGAEGSVNIQSRSIGKLGFYNVTGIIRPTTSVASAAFVQNAGTAINNASTFGGYTIQQLTQALQNLGLLT